MNDEIQAKSTDSVDKKMPEATRKKHKRITRRRFLAASSLAVAGAGATYFSTRRSIPVAIIGAGKRGNQLAWHMRYLGYVYNPYGDLRAICDVNLPRAENLRAKESLGADVYQNYRKVLERDDIKAVFIATPEHWHAQIAIEAMRAGKAVYCEKPLTLTIAESEKLVSVARETNAVFQVGTQNRSHGYFRTACELLRNGRLGKLQLADITLGEFRYNAAAGHCQSEPPPEGLDWEKWLGPASEEDYCGHVYRNWSRFWAYGGGQITGWGSHRLDIVHWAIGTENALPIRFSGSSEMPTDRMCGDTPYAFSVEIEYQNGLLVRIRSVPRTETQGVLFEGDKGRVFCNRARVSGKPVEDLSATPLPADAIRMHHSTPGRYGKTAVIQHFRNFFDCIETGETPIANIESAHITTTALHLANICVRLGRPIEFDPARFQIVDDIEASAMMSRPRRAPYTI